jgi:hypothetical protein
MLGLVFLRGLRGDGRGERERERGGKGGREEEERKGIGDGRESLNDVDGIPDEERI